MALKFAVDLQRKGLILSDRRPDPFQLPPFVQGDTYPLEIQIAQPNYAAGFGAYSLVNIAPFTMRVAIIGHLPIGNAADTPEVLQVDWTKDSATNCFRGVLSLNTAAIATLLGANTSKEAYFEIELRDGSTGYYQTIYPPQPTFNCLIIAEAIEDGVLVGPPPSGGTAMTTNEAMQLFVKRRGLPGEMFSLVSANGLWERIIGVDDNGAKLDQVIEYVP